MGEEPFALEGGVSGMVFGPARGEGVALPRQCQRLDGQEDQQVIRAQGSDARAGVEFEQYDEGPIKTDEKGMATPGPRQAWFKGPAGNIVSVIEGQIA